MVFDTTSPKNVAFQIVRRIRRFSTTRQGCGIYFHHSHDDNAGGAGALSAGQTPQLARTLVGNCLPEGSQLPTNADW